MKFTVTLTAEEDGGWVVECPELPGCISQGETEAEALHNIREAIEAVLIAKAEHGIVTRQVEVDP